MLQGAGSGPGEADILLILYFFVCGPAVGTVGHASPSVHSGPASSLASLRGHTAITAHHDPTSAIVLAGIVDSTHLTRSRVLGQVFTFRAPSVSPPPSSLPLFFSSIFFFSRRLRRRCLLLLPPLRFAVVVLYSRVKRSGRLSSLIASRVTVREALTFGISLFRDNVSFQCFKI